MPYLLQHPVTSLGDAPSSLESVDDSLVVQVRNNTNLLPDNTRIIFLFLNSLAGKPTPASTGAVGPKGRGNQGKNQQTKRKRSFSLFLWKRHVRAAPKKKRRFFNF